MTNNNCKHGKSYTKEYMVWSQMKDRCTNPNNKDYKDYGGRGITVCEKWLISFIHFYEDIGDIPKGLTLDRKDNNRGYDKENCRLVDRKTQNTNKRKYGERCNYRLNGLMTLNGETHGRKEWGKILKINPRVLWDRQRRGWPVEKILSTTRFNKITK